MIALKKNWILKFLKQKILIENCLPKNDKFSIGYKRIEEISK